jgi:uncharacterized membrane protein
MIQVLTDERTINRQFMQHQHIVNQRYKNVRSRSTSNTSRIVIHVFMGSLIKEITVLVLASSNWSESAAPKSAVALADGLPD